MDEGRLTTTPTVTGRHEAICLVFDRQVKRRACQCLCAQYRTATVYRKASIIGHSLGSSQRFLKMQTRNKTQVNASESCSMQVEVCVSFTVINLCYSRYFVQTDTRYSSSPYGSSNFSHLVAVSSFTLGFLRVCFSCCCCIDLFSINTNNSGESESKTLVKKKKKKKNWCQPRPGLAACLKTLD